MVFVLWDLPVKLTPARGHLFWALAIRKRLSLRLVKVNWAIRPIGIIARSDRFFAASSGRVHWTQTPHPHKQSARHNGYLKHLLSTLLSAATAITRLRCVIKARFLRMVFRIGQGQNNSSRGMAIAIACKMPTVVPHEMPSMWSTNMKHSALHSFGINLFEMIPRQHEINTPHESAWLHCPK